jgi:hypothetical protein
MAHRGGSKSKTKVESCGDAELGDSEKRSFFEQMGFVVYPNFFTRYARHVKVNLNEYLIIVVFLFLVRKMKI